MKGEIFELEKQFAFYGAYHNNIVNILIHVIFVWPILFTLDILFNYTPAFFPTPEYLNRLFFGQNLILFNIGFFLSFMYAVYYVILDKKAGTIAATLVLLCHLGSNFVINSLGKSVAWKVAVAGQLVSWFSQFFGHAVFEKRAPALLDNLAQAFLMAPFFVLLEVLMYFTKYEPYPGFAKRVKKMVDQNIASYRKKKE